MKTPEEQEIINKLTASGDYKVIERFTPVEQYNDANNDVEVKIGIFLDTETTGMNSDEDKVIELAMVPFEFDSYGNIYRILPEYNALQDPDEPILELITQITGINDEMVDEVARILGAPHEKLAGIYINKMLGQKVRKGERLYTLYAQIV